MAKGASTAKTFGVSMEESIGHITAISSVTMESGKIIGNSLKTIYSRITTLGDAQEILEGVGVALYEIGENGEQRVKPVNDILSDLAKRWHTLSDSERQNIAVKVAGRYQLSRFLALMNNYQTAIDATATALTSEGSAMKENNRYLESFEARINRLKNTFSEMSLAIGDAFLSGSMLLAIETLARLAEMATNVASSWGALPVIFFIVGTLLALMGVFRGSIGSTVAFLQLMKTAMVEASVSARGFGGAMAVASAGLRTFSVLAPTVVAGVRAIGGAMKGLLISTGIGALFVAIGFGIEKLVSHFQKQKKIQEEVEKANKSLVDSYRNTAGGLDELVAKHDELQRKVDNDVIKEGTEEYNEYLQVNSELAKALPTMVKYVDSKGVAHMQTTKAMEEEIKVAEELSRIQAELEKETYNDRLDERIGKIKDLAKEIKKLNDEQKDLEDQNGTTRTIGAGGGIIGQEVEITYDNDEAIQRTKIEAINAYQEIQKHVQRINLDIKDTVLASLEASGHLKDMSDTQKGAVESIITNNERFLTEIAEQMANTTDEKKLEELNGELESRANKLFAIGEDVGRMITNKANEMTAGIMDEERVKEIEKNFDNILKVLPKTFFSLESIENADVFKDNLEGILDIAGQIQGGEANFDGLIGQLEDLGLTTDQARIFVARLGYEYDNASIKAEVLKQQEKGLIDVTKDVIDVMLEATDVTENLFGYSDKDVSALKTHIETLQGLKYIYKDNAKEHEAWKNSIEQVSIRFGVSEEEVENNLSHYKQMIDFIDEFKFKYSEAGEIVGIETENMTKDQKKFWDELKHQGADHATLMDIITGKKTVLASGEIIDTQAVKENTDARQANKDAMKEESDAVDVLAQKFGTFKEDMSRINKSAYIETIQQQLMTLDGKITVTKDEAGKLKLTMADGSDSAYLTTLMGQFESLGIKVGLMQDESGNLKLVLNDGTGSTTLSTIDKQAKDAKISLDGTIDKVDILNEKKILPNDYSQIDFVGLSQGLDTSIEKVQLLSEALEGTAENITALDSIKASLDKLQSVADEIRASIKSTLDGTKGDIAELATQADDAKNSVKKLHEAIEDLKSETKSVNLGGFGTLKDDIGDAISSLRILDDDLTIVISSINVMSGNVKDTSDDIVDAVEDAEDSFKDMAKTVESKTTRAIRSHNEQKSAIDNLANSARLAKTAIERMNDSAKNAMDDLDRYISRATRARSVSSGSSGGLFRMFGLGTTSNTLNDGVASAMSSFSASAEGVMGDAGGGGEGSSGIVRPSIYGGMNADGDYLFNAFNLADLVSPNYNERDMTATGGIISQLEGQLARLTKNATQYRDKLKSIIYYQNIMLSLTQKELNATIERNKWVNARLKQLGNTKSHTEAQREEYNKLQQEYDSNLSKIASLKGQVESITNEIRQKSLEMFNDFVDEVLGRWDEAISAIKSRVDDIDFQLDVLGLTDPENVEEQLELLAEKANKLKEEEQTSGNKVTDLQGRYDSAVSQYGADSEQAKKLLQELKQAQEEYEDAVIKTLQAEKQIKDVRGEVADEGIKQLKDYYSNMKDMALKAIEIERRELEKAHKAKMDMYDDEIEKINSVYDEKLKSMDKEKSQAEYQEELDNKNAKKAELLNKISLLSRDTSLEGRQKVAELQAELASVEEEIADFMEARQDELLRQQLEEQKQAQIDAVNAQKEAETTTYDEEVARLDQEKTDITSHYDEILNDEQYWADMRNQFIQGSFQALTTELGHMSQQLDQMSKGNFDNLTQNFANFSDEVKKEFEEMNKLAIKNMEYLSSGVIGQVGQVGDTSYTPYTGDGQNITAPEYTSAVTTQPTPAPTPQPAPVPEPRYHSVASGDTLWELAQAYYGNPYKWTNIAQANGNIDPRKLQIGQKLLIPFRDGGYTGEWAGDDGRVALLHKKENVFDEDDTKNLLDASKILRKIKDVLPVLKRSSVLDKVATAGSIVNISYGDIIVNVQGGDKKKARDIAKEILDGMKKKGG